MADLPASSFDVAVVGAGISGLTFAHHVAARGSSVAVLEQEDRPGGCVRTVDLADGYWFELGAHTLYNSYGSLLDIITQLGLQPRLQHRTKAPYRLWVDGKIRSVPSQLALGELLASAWRAFTEQKAGRTVGDYYGHLVGKRNWQRVFSPLLSAVPSQKADDFPAEMLFKKRPRRKDFPRTFTFQGGLGILVAALAARPGLNLMIDTKVDAVERTASGFQLSIAGRTLTAKSLALAVPPDEAARLLQNVAPNTAAAVAAVHTTAIDSTGVVLEKNDLPFPPLAGLVPLDDVFFSAVSRDVVPDPTYRALAFHFRRGLSFDERLHRIAAVTGAPREAFRTIAEHQATLPSPALGHADLVTAIDRSLPRTGLYLTGNYFGGLAIEDCVLRSTAEATRLSQPA